jgi:hypothetical protein
MQSRVRQAFRPGLASATGADYLECRRLLSVVVATGDTAEVAPVRAVANSTVGSRGEDSSPSPSVASKTQTESTTDLAGAGGESTGPRIQVSEDSAPSPAEARSETSPRDAGQSDATIVAIPASARATVAHGAFGAQQTSVVDPTPWDEGGATRLAESPALEQSGGGGALIIPGAGAANAGAGPAGPSIAPASPLSAPETAAAPVLPGTASSVPANEALTIELGADGALLMSAGPDTYRMPAGFVPSPAPPYLVTPEPGEEARSNVEGVVTEPALIEESAPSPRSAGLLTEFLPFDRASLEDAIDRFLAPLENLGGELLDWRPSPGLVHAAAFVTAATVATEAVRRRLRIRGASEDAGEEDFARFPGHPSAWGFGEP